MRQPFRHSPPLRVPFLAGLLGFCIACNAGGPESPVAEPEPLAVEAVAARTGSLPLEERVGGTVRARNQVTVRAELEATVANVEVRDGDTVRAGDLMVVLRDDVRREQVRRAEADIASAEASAAAARAELSRLEAEVARTRRLAEEELVSPLDLETLEARTAAARARVEEADAGILQARATADERRADSRRLEVRAPVGGRVGGRAVEVGARVGAGDALFVVGDPGRVIVEIPLTEALLESVRVGTPARVRVRDREITATLSRISPFLETGSFSTTAEIDVDGGGLRPGTFVDVTVLRGRSDETTLIPRAAVWEDPRTGTVGTHVVDAAGGLEIHEGDGPGDMPAETRPILFRPLEVLAEGGGTVGVRGVEEGEWVLIVGHHLVRERARRQEGDAAVLARVRAARWDRILEFQSLQREDLLADFLDKQERIGRLLGAEIPESEDVVREALAADAERGS